MFLELMGLQMTGFKVSENPIAYLIDSPGTHVSLSLSPWCMYHERRCNDISVLAREKVHMTSTV
jgi:hypothetical protein